MSIVNESLVYLFYIKAENGREYYLTSANEEIRYSNSLYLPYSGLTLLSGKFDDSAENYVILHGIFEELGINKNDDIMGASIKIMYLRRANVWHLVTYICTQHSIKDLDFEIRCESESIKYNQSLLQTFSKTCRANFGDNRCKVNINDYSVICDLLSSNGKILLCDIQGLEDDYFKGGVLVANDQHQGQYKFKILTHTGNNIEIEMISEFDFSDQKQVKLIPACDKNFRTCCYSFNNAVNFRGEPVIPEYNVIKN